MRIRHFTSHLTKSLLVLSLVNGCTTTGSYRQTQDQRIAADIAALTQRTIALEQRVAAMEELHERNLRSFDQVGSDISRLHQQLENAIAQQSQGLQKEAAAREAMYQELIKSLSQRIAEIMKAHATTATQHAESGYEHVVKPGETLSEIARAYGVSMQVIIRANNIQTPDRLKTGQTLFIPE